MRSALLTLAFVLPWAVGGAVLGVASPAAACDSTTHGCVRNCSALPAGVCLAGDYAQVLTVNGVLITGSVAGGESNAGSPTFQQATQGSISFTFTDADNNPDTNPLVHFTVSAAQVTGLTWNDPTSQVVTYDANGPLATLVFHFTVSGKLTGPIEVPFTFVPSESSQSGHAEFPLVVVAAGVDIPFVGIAVVVGALAVAASAARRR